MAAVIITVCHRKGHRFFRRGLSAPHAAVSATNRWRGQCRDRQAGQRRSAGAVMAGVPLRTLEDLDRTVRAIATVFETDAVFIIGSQAILLAWPDAPDAMRTSLEIDAYPANARMWEMAEKAKHPEDDPQASEQIDALFGSGSQFHRTHGFYIDGVDENTAKLPADWRARALVHPVDVRGKRVVAIAPSPEDVIVSKLARLDDKDKMFIESYHAARPLDGEFIEGLIAESSFEPEIANRAVAYIRRLMR
jgi:hypothetical protein